MVSKIRYWKCVDCSSMINDTNMLIDDNEFDFTKYVEFCYGCLSYNPEVVIAYA
jgi:hypothetical protein